QCAKAQDVKSAQGIGDIRVTAGVADEVALLAAWKKATSKGRRVMIEDHVVGTEVRMITVGGKLASAICRAPVNGAVDECVSVIDHLHPSIIALAERAASALPYSILLGL